MPIYRANDPVVTGNMGLNTPPQPLGAPPTPAAPNITQAWQGLSALQPPPPPTYAGNINQGVTNLASSMAQQGAGVNGPLQQTLGGVRQAMQRLVSPSQQGLAPGEAYASPSGGSAYRAQNQINQDHPGRDQQTQQLMQSVSSQWGQSTPQQKWAMMYSNPQVRNEILQNPGQWGFNSANDVNNFVNNSQNMTDFNLAQGGNGPNPFAPNQPLATPTGRTGQGTGNFGSSGGQISPPTYPLPGATPGQVPGTSWPSNNIGPGGPQQYFPTPNPQYLSSNNPTGAQFQSPVYQPSTPGGKMGGAPSGGKMGGGQPPPIMHAM